MFFFLEKRTGVFLMTLRFISANFSPNQFLLERIHLENQKCLFSESESMTYLGPIAAIYQVPKDLKLKTTSSSFPTTQCHCPTSFSVRQSMKARKTNLCLPSFFFLKIICSFTMLLYCKLL